MDARTKARSSVQSSSRFLLGVEVSGFEPPTSAVPRAFSDVSRIARMGGTWPLREKLGAFGRSMDPALLAIQMAAPRLGARAFGIASG